jgi:NAD(P)-dependent dehydrogenase (short-subunit alcohol dehydrogenase family)
VNCLRPIVEMNMDDWNWVISTNLGGTFNTLRAFLPGMLRQPTARHVLYTGSMSSLYSPHVAGLSAYTAAKMGILGLSAVLEDEVGLDALGQTFAFIGSAESDMSSSALRRRPGRSMARPSDKARGVKRISAEEASRIMIEGVKAGRRFVASHGDLAQDFIPFQDAQRAAFRSAGQAP